MLLIETRVAPSRIHGLGLFAVKFIPRGTPVWKFQPGFDREFSSAEFTALPPEAQRHLRWFAFLDSNSAHWNLSGDHACFMNHSPEPNTGAPPRGNLPVITMALRDIAAGEEITCDYFAFDAEAAAKLASSTAN
jgi:uncharacterized protein